MILIFCGIPGSGKTTIARRVAKLLRAHGSVQLFISDKLSAPVYKRFLRLLEENLGKYDFLIFDATFYKKAWREEMKRRAGNHTALVVYLKCRAPVAIQRNTKRRAGIPGKAVHIMASRFEAPSRPDIVIDTEETSASESVQKIVRYVVRSFREQ